MRSELENAVKDEAAALEEDISPVPAIIFDYAMCFCFDPPVEGD